MFLLAFAALATERLIGYPDWIFKRIGHPVTWIGRLISRLDKDWNRDTESLVTRKRKGLAALFVLIAVTVLLAWGLQRLLLLAPFGPLLLVLVAASLPAQKSLETHVAAVADALKYRGIEAGRNTVSMIVGRDPQTLDEAGVCRAAIESLAENFSDGVVAPTFWIGVGGLAGGAAYKAANTADSMIGHRTPRHEAFGWAAARFDDLINLPASRLSALLIIVAAYVVDGASPWAAWNAVKRDARHHTSPNAGWPEAAVAGALGLALAGPRTYGGKIVDAAYMGEGGRSDLSYGDISKALKLIRCAHILLLGLLGSLAATIALV